ncbi:MAG TPA: TonB-dependent receptor, partial [Vicinamibacteria bacterium]
LEVAANGKLGEKTNVVVGGLTERRANRDIPETIPGVQAPAIPGKYSEKHYSAYVQADHSVRDRLKLVSGVQWNRTGSGHTAAVPRLGAIVPVSETLTLKALWGQAFRTATPLEEFVNVPGVLLGRADLRPEKASTFDVQLFLDRARSQSTLTLFHNQYRDVVERIPAVGAVPGTSTFQNSGVNTIQGLELEHRGRLARGFFLTGSVTLQDEKEGKLLVPSYMAKAGVSYSGKNLSGGLFHSHFGCPREAPAPLGGLELNPPAHAINLLSLNVNYKVRAGVPLTLSLYGSNLLGDDMEYTEFARGWTNTLPIGPGRALYGRIRVEF